MSILEDLTSLLATKGVPVETGIFSDEAPDAYVVITFTLTTRRAWTSRRRGFRCTRKAATRR